MKRVIRNAFLLAGILTTLQALMLSIRGYQVALVNFVLIAIIVLQFIYIKGNVTFYKYKIPVYLLFLTFVISSIGSYFFLPQIWSSASVKATIKYVLLLLPIILLFTDDELKDYRKYFFNGLLISSWIQLFWELAQLISFYEFRFQLNEFVFGQIMNLKVDHPWTFILDNQFRPSGVSWEPANLSLALVIGFILTKKTFGKLLFSFGIIMSTSRTGMLVWLLCLCIYLLYYIRTDTKNIYYLFKRPWIIAMSSVILVLVLSYLVTQTNLMDIVNNNFKRILAGINGTDTSSMQHINYYWQSFIILIHSNLFQILFGYGTGIAGYPFTEFFNIFFWKPGAWNPESDFVTLLIGNGVFGFFLYYWSAYKSVKFNMLSRNNLMIMIMICISGIMYIYIRSSWTLLIILLLFVDSSSKNNENVSVYNVWQMIRNKTSKST